MLEKALNPDLDGGTIEPIKESCWYDWNRTEMFPVTIPGAGSDDVWDKQIPENKIPILTSATLAIDLYIYSTNFRSSSYNSSSSPSA